ncbi:MAG: hypothetical protein LZ174_09920 [Thaumarchaeota archaeon]|jgi:hypothetical protein|nr:hypothetical protein [Candidatus Geocrenenecus arthurdayi]
MPSEEIIDLSEAERIAIRLINTRIRNFIGNLPIKNIIIDSTDLKQLGNLLIYEVNGRAEIIIRPKGLFHPEEVEYKMFTAKIHANSGKPLGITFQ